MTHTNELNVPLKLEEENKGKTKIQLNEK